MAEPWIDTEVVTAAQLAALPWGVMGYVIGSTADQAGIGAAFTDITSLSVSFTAVASRLYRTTVNVNLQQLTSTAVTRVQIADGAGTQKMLRDATLVANDEANFTLVLIETGLSGAITRKAQANTSAGTVTIQGTSNRFPTFTVEDIGPG